MLQGGPEQLFNLKGVEAGLGDADVPDDDMMDVLEAGSDDEVGRAGRGERRGARHGWERPGGSQVGHVIVKTREEVK